MKPLSMERYWKQKQEQGDYRPKRIGGYRRSRLEGYDGSIGRWISKQNDMTLVEIQHRCRKELGIKIGVNALWHRLKRIGLSYKKTTHASEQERPDVVAKELTAH